MLKHENRIKACVFKYAGYDSTSSERKRFCGFLKYGMHSFDKIWIPLIYPSDVLACVAMPTEKSIPKKMFPTGLFCLNSLVRCYKKVLTADYTKGACSVA